jgi:D-aminopeptidase
MSSPPSPRPRARDLGVVVGAMAPGATNTIVDVGGVRVGHVTCWHDTPTVARTGVTAIVPAPLDELFHDPMAVGTAVLNGAGELTGSIAVDEWGTLETPVLLTGTLAVGRAFDGAVGAVLDAVPVAGNGIGDVVIPMVGECDDSWLDDARARHVTAEHATRAIADATNDAPALGAIGAGSGMSVFDCKGGIGSASRFVPELDAVVGVLLLANFGALPQLTVAGDPVGRRLAAEGFGDGPPTPAGSCIVVIATDAPIDAHACRRLSARAGLGLARVGSVGHHGSGEIFVAFSTTARQPRDAEYTDVRAHPATGSWLNPLFEAAIEATEEAALDSMFVADTVTGRDGNTAPAFPVEALAPHVFVA